MGQCMEEKSAIGKFHPFLGYLGTEHQDGRSLLTLNMAISGEEEYIEWSKRVTKLRYCN
jgi:hypothetical protein